ncbi:NADH:ubiquinone oxidoreductase, Na translocating, B subunit [Thermosipho melanesiensis]|uniref:NQR2 and RnfD family protein n=2 Tax=Thermosipho melanesiensis TaxID=46541 RepID=A6LKR5_THEM4|nr:RnfABCDGE type electron transport complex subunit D [Thermosipho melanesiensis]ABR30516.1 NQR2 and RnfD family protein [Thermosipho melanesiensis BI429]APT73667.1 NADH:ubiquinone oxidoreductase, Na translocating, B subunit [Thermosipho melanesiensis]OOC35607.1 NADH:ubiquinone oxidoreductase, Na translocating, B subunit [Thermosipho melanesiensis]OOC39281.1 NADH:ubiquinone oxidoreductase, Na translocating, B subunit [Thermosipho melanesiensis]OOC39367.1 NADH:ubiquinone oxidoreductase, Na tra
MHFFQKQPMMRRVIYALFPIYIYAFLFYGFRLVFLSILIFTAGILTEYLFEKRKNKKVSEAVLVSCMLYTLSLPPNVPWWIAVIGIVFGIAIAKEAYGGFGRNVFNPAITGRLFVYVTFPTFMTSGWLVAKFGSFGKDAITSATPLAILRYGGSVDIAKLFLGLRAGSFGEGAMFLILLGAIYLIVTRTASFRIMLSTFLSASAFILLFDLFLGKMPFLLAILSGSLIFVSVFIATDPITAPKNKKAQIIYGLIIGTSIAVIRSFSLFSEGTSFAILLGNTFAPLLDFLTKKVKK